jgi:pilus assembly protein CpaB
MLVVVLALVFGGSAAVGVNSLLQNQQVPKGEMVSVVVAATDVPRGGLLTAELLKSREFPKDLAPANAISKIEDALDRTVFIPLIKDDPILSSKLAPKGSGRGMSALVPKGMRAFTIHTPSIESGVAGFVLPGNRVDVLLTVGELPTSNQFQLNPAPVGPAAGSPLVSPPLFSAPRSTGGGSTTTLLQNIEILAVDQKIEAPAENKMDARELRSVTLLVTPQHANLLDLGQSKGTLHLALRNIEDKDNSRTRPATLSDLQFHQEPPWDVKAKSVLAALGQALAQRRLAAKPPEPATPAEPPTAMIRTVRGIREGGVLVPLRQAPSVVTSTQPPAPKG